MKKKSIISLVLVGILALGIAGCSKKENDEKTIKIGVSPKPHKEIVEYVKDDIEAKGYKLEIIEFNDYVKPNTAVNEGELDANFFQHIPYLEETNKKSGTDLVWTKKIHIEPLGLYSKKIKSLEELKDGATIAIPNDPTNGSRALKLLAENKIIKVEDKELVTIQDITDNPKNLDIKELEAAQVPRSLEDVDAAVINTNYALDAGLKPTEDSIIIESKDSPYANVLVVKASNKDSEKTKVLNEALTSDKVKKFIEDNYNGAVIPAF